MQYYRTSEKELMCVSRGASCVVTLLIGGIIIYFGQKIPSLSRVRYYFIHENFLADAFHAVLPCPNKDIKVWLKK